LANLGEQPQQVIGSVLSAGRSRVPAGPAAVARVVELPNDGLIAWACYIYFVSPRRVLALDLGNANAPGQVGTMCNDAELEDRFHARSTNAKAAVR
jgi:hypothetical protein